MSNVIRLPTDCPDLQAQVGRLWQRGYDTAHIAIIINSAPGRWLVTEADVANALAIWRDRKAAR